MPRKPGSKDTKPRKARGGGTPKKEAANGEAKKKTTASEEPGIGHNAAGSEAERQKLHLKRHVPDYKSALEEKKAADANFKNVCKTIKSEGGSVAAIKVSIALETPAGEKAFKARLAVEIEAATWNGYGVQAELFGETDRTPAVDRAKADGMRAGMRGDPCKPPHDHSTPQGQAWIESWHEGQAVKVKEGIRPLAEADNTSSLIPANRPDADPTRSNDDFGDALNDTAQGEGGDVDFGLGAAAEGDKFLEEQRAKETT